MARGGGAAAKAGGGFIKKMLGDLIRPAARRARRSADDLGRQAPKHAPPSRRYLPHAGDRAFVKPGSKQAHEAYERIRNKVGDTDAIARNTAIPKSELDRIKNHIFVKEHKNVPIGPNKYADGGFAPMDDTAKLWEKAEAGTLSPEELTDFKRWARHEGVESRLMDRGLPYVSGHSSAWDPDLGSIGNPQHHGAHDLAPLAGGDPPFRHWPNVIGQQPPDVTIADDLSNLDEVADTIYRTRGGAS